MAVINFLIVAWVVFLLVKMVNRIKAQAAPPTPEAEEPKGPTQEELLAEIRDGAEVARRLGSQNRFRGDGVERQRLGDRRVRQASCMNVETGGEMRVGETGRAPAPIGQPRDEIGHRRVRQCDRRRSREPRRACSPRNNA